MMCNQVDQHIDQLNIEYTLMFHSLMSMIQMHMTRTVTDLEHQCTFQPHTVNIQSNQTMVELNQLHMRYKLSVVSGFGMYQLHTVSMMPAMVME